MEERIVHPMEALLLYTARALRDQYSPGETRDEFTRHIEAAEESGTKSGAPSDEHEQGKLAPAPEAAPTVDSRSLEPNPKE